MKYALLLPYRHAMLSISGCQLATGNPDLATSPIQTKNMTKYFLYARKSTDVEDKQVRSIDDQLAVLRALAKERGLTIIEEFVEKQSAKMPGRPIFNEMMERIEKGEARGIVCWKLDRLARNPVDGGQISWMLQRGIIQHIQTHDRSYRPNDNVLMMSVEFGMANQYILDLSTNTKRGLYEKVKRGEYPNIAPIGYINDVRIKQIVVDRKKAKIVKEAFELYSRGQSRLEDISELFLKHGVRSKEGNRLHSTRIVRILTNPLYCGLFRYGGEMYEGKHETIITKQLFDRVQEVLRLRGKPERKANDPQALCGLLRCATCGMMVTAEQKTKYQKNGNVHHYTYYRCSKKSKVMKCSEPCIREEELDRQLTALIKNYALPVDWAVELSKMADKDEKEAVQSASSIVQGYKAEIQAISQKLQRLLNAYLDQDIEREIYRSEKAELLFRKKSLEEKMSQVAKGVSVWIEPLREWIKDGQNIDEIVSSPSLNLKKVTALKIFGLNLTLHAREARGVPEKQWASIAEAHCLENKIPLNLLLVQYS